MASGFGLAAFGEGLDRGFGTGTRFVDNFAQRNVQQQALEETRQAREFTREQAKQKQKFQQMKFMADTAKDNLAQMQQSIQEAVEANNPTAAQNILRSFTAPLTGGRSMIEMRADALNAIAPDTVSAEAITQRLQALADSAVTLEEASAREAEADLARGRTIAQATGRDLGTAMGLAQPRQAPQPTMAGFVVPLLQKLASGEELTPEETQALQMAQKKGGQVITVFNDQGKPIAMIGGQGPTPGTTEAVTAEPGGQVGLGTGLPETQQFRQNQRVEGLDTALADLDQMITRVQEQPEDYGVIGAVRTTAQEAVGVLEDLATSMGEGPVANVAQWAANELGSRLFDEKLPAIELKQEELATRLAALRLERSGQSFRAMKTFLDKAREDVSLQGLKTSQAVAERLQEIRQTFEDERNALIQGLSGQEAAPRPGATEGAGSASGPPPGAATATNPETGQKVYQDPGTGAWVPY